MSAHSRISPQYSNISPQTPHFKVVKVHFWGGMACEQSSQIKK